MSIKIMSLNCEGSKHIDRWLPFAHAQEVDVLCVQEVFEQDIPRISQTLGISDVHFAPMSIVSQENDYKIPLNGSWGVALFSKCAHGAVKEQYYAKSRTVGVFTEPNSVSRVLLSATFEKEGQEFTVGTTHFTWSSKGQDTAEQHKDFVALKSLLGLEPNMILCGDFNSPRGGVMYDKFLEVFADGLPAEVTTTIDPNLHYAGALQLAVDSFFYSSHYQPESVSVHSGLSDHQGLVGEFSRVAG